MQGFYKFKFLKLNNKCFFYFQINTVHLFSTFYVIAGYLMVVVVESPLELGLRGRECVDQKPQGLFNSNLLSSVQHAEFDFVLFIV